MKWREIITVFADEAANQPAAADTTPLGIAAQQFAGVFDALTYDDTDARRGRVFRVETNGKKYRIQVELNP